MRNITLSFIGGGNMARSLIGGLIADGFDPARIRVADSDPEQCRRLTAAFPMFTTPDGVEAAEGSDAVVLAVKPQAMRDACRALAEVVRARRPLIVSVAAGVRERDIDAWLGGGAALVRAMPNTPALVGAGATGLHANAKVTETQRELAESILRAVGLTVWLDEEAQLDAVTGVSGSGPAYFFRVMEALQAAAEAQGLPADTARLLVLQTAYGAAKMALESEEPPAGLRARVTSPGGTTERAIEALQAGDVDGLFRDAVGAARRRAEELSAQFGETGKEERRG